MRHNRGVGGYSVCRHGDIKGEQLNCRGEVGRRVGVQKVLCQTQPHVQTGVQIAALNRSLR